MPSPQPIRLIKNMTVMIDACAFRYNPAIGEQLAAILSVLKTAYVKCEVRQDRFCLMEATCRMHELMLSEDIDKMHITEHGGAKEASRALQHAPPDYVQNYISTTAEIAKQVPIKYVQATGLEEIYQEREELVKTYIFNDPRLKEWPKTVEKLRDNRIKPSQLDEYEHALFAICSTCAHTIEGIHGRMKREKGFKGSISNEDKKAFMLDKFPEGRRVYWDNIDLTKIDPDHIPIPIIDAFGKTKISNRLLGKDGPPTELGKLMIHRQMDLGEKVMEHHAREIITGVNAPKPTSNNIVLLITDDKLGFQRFEKLQQEFPSCIPITSRECATLVCEIAKEPTLKHHFNKKMLARATDIHNGITRTDSPIARSAEHIQSDGNSFAKRVTTIATLDPAIRARL